MRRIILVPGTFGYKGELAPEDRRVEDLDWFNAGHPTHAWLTTRGLAPLLFWWSTDVGGVGFGTDDLRDWKAAGLQLFNMAVPPVCPERRIGGDELIVLTHSHGLQVALSAAAAGLKIALLIDVCGPVRSDMLAVAERGRPHVRRWVHLHGGRRDRWQWRGSLFDSWDPRTWFRVQRTHPLADVNRGLSEADHGVFLRDPAWRWVLEAALQEAPTWPVVSGDEVA